MYSYYSTRLGKTLAQFLFILDDFITMLLIYFHVENYVLFERTGHCVKSRLQKYAQVYILKITESQPLYVPISKNGLSTNLQFFLLI